MPLKDAACDDVATLLQVSHTATSAASPLSSAPTIISQQLDHARFAVLAVLQLLHYAAHGSCGELLLLREADAPELRLRVSTELSTFNTLPGGLCSPAAAAPSSGAALSREAPLLSRLLDYRCHTAGLLVGRHFEPQLLRCLETLTPSSPSEAALRSSATPLASASAALEASAERLRNALGAITRTQRDGLGRMAARLLELGLEGTLRTLLSGCERCPREEAPPACCSLPEDCCARASAEGGASAEGAAGASAEGSDRALPLHPLHMEQLETEELDASSTRPAAAAAAASAGPLLADAAPYLPHHFSRAWRNPCWACNLSEARLCCLPYAHVLGVSKCGTTDLHARLALHPHVLRSKNKGPHFWDEKHAFRWYLDIFAPGAAQLRSGEANPEAISIDASSNTLTYSGVGVRGARAEPPLLLPQLMRWLQPNLRLLLMLREPGARYLSAYCYYERRYRIYSRFGPLSAESFGRMAAAETARFGSCRRERSACACARREYAAAEQLVKGLYAPFLQDWLAAFPAHRLLVLRLEDYDVALAQHLRRTLRFLGLPQPPSARWRRMLAQPRANRRASATAMAAETRALLSAFYAPFNEQLVRLMGDARFAWADVLTLGSENRNASSSQQHEHATGSSPSNRLTLLSIPSSSSSSSSMTS